MNSPESNTIVVRPVDESDLNSIDVFIQPFVASGKLLRRTFDELAELIEHAFVAELEGKMVGFVALEIYSAKLAEIRSLAVDPACQGQGIGKQLVAACVAQAKRRNILEVMAITSADSFFMDCGFDFTLPGEKKALFIQTRTSTPKHDS